MCVCVSLSSQSGIYFASDLLALTLVQFIFAKSLNDAIARQKRTEEFKAQDAATQQQQQQQQASRADTGTAAEHVRATVPPNSPALQPATAVETVPKLQTRK